MIDAESHVVALVEMVEPDWRPVAGWAHRISDLRCDPVRDCRFSCAGRSPGHPRAGASGVANATSDSEEHVRGGAGQASRDSVFGDASEVGSPQGASGRASRMPANQPGPVRK